MRILALAALLVAAPAHAQMYKCVDERGVTSYTDKPRPECKGAKVDIQGQPPIGGELKAAPARPGRSQEDADFRRRQAEREHADAADKARLQESCARLRREESFLASGRRLMESDGKGERAFVDDASRVERLQRVREQLRTCP